MTVGEAILYIEDIVDKYSAKYYEPTEILNRIERETYVVLETSTKDDSLKSDLNWEIANLFIDTVSLTASKTVYAGNWLNVIEGFNIVDGDEIPARRRKTLNKSRNPFIAPTDYYPDMIDMNGYLTIRPFVASNGNDGSFANILTRPTFGVAESDLLICKAMTDSQGSSFNVEANRSLIDRVLSNVVVSLAGSQNNQTMQYEWAKLNKQEGAQQSGVTAQPQQQ